MLLLLLLLLLLLHLLQDTESPEPVLTATNAKRVVSKVHNQAKAAHLRGQRPGTAVR